MFVKEGDLFYSGYDYAIRRFPIIEASILKFLNHPFIVGLDEIQIDGDKIKIMTEKCFPLYDETTLELEKEDKLFPPKMKDKKKFIITSLEGLCYLHDNNIIHADIKTANLMTDNTGKCKYIDFGMSLYQTEPFIKTTYEFRAPEIVNDEIINKKSDVWSLGVVFLHLLHGFIPHNISSVFRFIEENNIKEYFLLKMLEEDYMDRWSARECFEFLTKMRCPIKIEIIEKINIPGRNNQITPKIRFDGLFWIMSIANKKWKKNISCIKYFVSLHDKIISRMSVKNYKLLLLCIFGIIMQIYENEVIIINDLQDFHIFSSEQYSETCKDIFKITNFDLFCVSYETDIIMCILGHLRDKELIKKVKQILL